MQKIFIFGDSIAYGAWDPAGGWVERLRQWLFVTTRDEYNLGTFLYNLSVVGDTTTDLLKRFLPEIEARQSGDMIFFAAGLNDAQFVDGGRWRRPLQSAPMSAGLFSRPVRVRLSSAGSGSRRWMTPAPRPCPGCRTGRTGTPRWRCSRRRSNRLLPKKRSPILISSAPGLPTRRIGICCWTASIPMRPVMPRSASVSKRFSNSMVQPHKRHVDFVKEEGRHGSVAR